jgi:hypothetical protein
MIKYKDGKPQVSDKASIILSNYKSTVNNFELTAKEAINQYKKKILNSINSL